MNEMLVLEEKSAEKSAQQQGSQVSPNDSQFNEAQWFIISEPKSHKKGKGGPSKRWGHSAVWKDNSLLIYGGGGRNPKNVKHWQCIYELDLLEWDWNKLESNNRAPAIRDSHSAVLLGNYMYVYGGSDGVSKRNDEFYRFDLNSSTWEVINAEGDVPPGREGHIAHVLQGKYMVVYGGWGMNEELLTDTYCFDIEKKNWFKVIKKSGPDMKPRESFGSCAIKDYIYIFGGQGRNENIGDYSYEVYLNDLFRFKLEVEGDQYYSVWEEVQFEGPKPSKRASASVCSFKDRYVFVIGGEGYPKEFDEESPLGSNPKKQRDILQKYQRTEEEDELIFTKNDVWYYDSELSVWNKLKTKNSNDFIPHFAHSATEYEDFIVIFGGLSNDFNSPHSEICILSLTGEDPKKLRSKKKKKENEDTGKKDSESVTQPRLSLTPRCHAPLCQLCKNRLTNAYNAITATHQSAKIIDSKSEDSSKNKKDTSLVSKGGPIVTGAFLHMLSQLIGWPFGALGLLIDNSMMMEANSLHIDIITRKEVKEEYIPQTSTTRTNAIEEEIKPVEETEMKVEPNDIKQEQNDIKQEQIKEEEEKSKEPKEQREQREQKEQKEQKEADQFEDKTYLQFIDDGLTWNPEDFVDLIADYDAVSEEEFKSLQTQDSLNESKEDNKFILSPLKKQYALNLKIGGFRLGNTVVILSRNGSYTCLGYICIQRMTNIHMSSSNSFLSVCWDTTTGEYKTVNGAKTKQIILSAIQNFISEPELMDMASRTSGTKVLIMNLRKVPISRRDANRVNCEYELVNMKDKPGEPDDIHIRTLDHDLKRKLQSGVKTPMLEFSMLTYLRLFFLEPNLTEGGDKSGNQSEKKRFDIFFKGKKIEFINVKKMIDQKRESEKELFVEFMKPKMFEGVAGVNREVKGIYEHEG